MNIQTKNTQEIEMISNNFIFTYGKNWYNIFNYTDYNNLSNELYCSINYFQNGYRFYKPDKFIVWKSPYYKSYQISQNKEKQTDLKKYFNDHIIYSFFRYSGININWIDINWIDM